MALNIKSCRFSKIVVISSFLIISFGVTNAQTTSVSSPATLYTTDYATTRNFTTVTNGSEVGTASLTTDEWGSTGEKTVNVTTAEPSTSQTMSDTGTSLTLDMETTEETSKGTESFTTSFTTDRDSTSIFVTKYETDTTTNVMTDSGTQLVTEIQTINVTEIVTQNITEMDGMNTSDFVTDVRTKNSTEIVTDFVTTIHTINVTEIVTENVTEMDGINTTVSVTDVGTTNSNDIVTDFITEIQTINVTEIVTEKVTEKDGINTTDSVTDVGTTNSNEVVTDFITEMETINVTEIVTVNVTEMDGINTTEAVTNVGTTNSTEIVTYFVTEIQTIKVTEIVTEDMTEMDVINVTDTTTEPNTKNATDITDIGTKIITERITEIVTDVATDIVTSSSPNKTDFATELSTIVNTVTDVTPITSSGTQGATDETIITLDVTTSYSLITMTTDMIRTSIATLISTDPPDIQTTDTFSTDITTSPASTAPQDTTLLPSTTDSMTTESASTVVVTTAETTPMTITTEPDSTTTESLTTAIPTTSASTSAKETTPTSTTTKADPTTQSTTVIETTPMTQMTTEKRNVDDDLKELEETPVTDENVEEISKELAELTEDSEDMTSDGVETTAEILGNITALNSSEPEVTSAVVETVNNLMSVDEDQLEEAANEGATNAAVQSLESQLQFVNVSATNGTYKDVQPNLGVQVSEYPPEELTEGLTFLYATDDPGGQLMPEHVIVFKGNNENMTSIMNTTPVQAQLFLPPSIGKAIGSGNNTRVSFVLYRTTSLFPSRSLLASNKGKAYNRTSNTRIISASVDGMTITNLSEPVLTTYVPIIAVNDTNTYNESIIDVTNPACVFWDFDADDGYGNWSTDGCQLVGLENETDGELRCQCNHLTNFAVLMDIYGGSTLDDKWTFILDVMSYVGCSLSIFFLLVTIFTFLSVRKLRNSQPSRILMCLCTSLLCLYIFFIILASLKSVTIVTCGIIVGFLHFSLLSSISWMAVESFNMYLMVIKIFDRGAIHNFMIKAVVFTIGAPTVIVGLTGGITQRDYIRYDDGVCGFLTKFPMIGGILVPIATVIIYDSIIFIMVIRRLSKKVHGRQVTKPVYKERLHRLQNASALIILMGLTWAVGFLTAIEGASVSVQMIFIILNSLQGFFLFLFYCLRNPAARSQWRQTLCCCKPSGDATTSNSKGTRSGSHTRSTTDDSRNDPDDHEKKWYHVLMGKTGSYDLTRGWRGKSTKSSSTFELSSESTMTTKKQAYRISGHYDDDDDGDGINDNFRNDNVDYDDDEDGVETTFGNSDGL